MSAQADRREFLKVTSLGLVGGALGVASGCRPAATVAPTSPSAPANLAAATTRFDDWTSIRDQFNLSREYIHLALLYLASHPKPVRDAIERHRQGFDQDP